MSIFFTLSPLPYLYPLTISNLNRFSKKPLNHKFYYLSKEDIRISARECEYNLASNVINVVCYFFLH